MGYLRLLLCFPVIYLHIASDTVAARAAVSIFFMLSSYLTCEMLNTNYKGGIEAKGYFLLNRLLRLYPVYLVALAFSTIMLLQNAADKQGMYDWQVLPNTFSGILKQFTILGISTFSGATESDNIVSVAWSLSTEIFYYLLIGLWLGERKKLLTLFWFFTFEATIIAVLSGASFFKMYLSIQGPAIFFLSGAMGWHYRSYFSSFLIKRTWAAIALAIAGLYAIIYLVPAPEFADSHPWLYKLNSRICSVELIYPFAPLFLLIIISLHQKKNFHWMEKWCADLAYPTFLCHIPMAWVVLYFYQPDATHQHILFLGPHKVFFIVTTILTILFSLCQVILVERPLKPYRELIRKKAQCLQNTSSSYPATASVRK